MKIFFSLLFVTSLLFSQTINEQIHALEKASPEQRVELMNSIKKQLISMNQEKRMKTIGDLQKKLQAKHEQRSSENTDQLENDNRDEPTNDSRLEQHEMQEHMMNSSHGEDSERHQSFENHELIAESEERNGDANNNHNDFRR